MSEEEIIKNVKQTIEEYEEVIQEEQEKGNVEDVESGIETKQAIQDLLDLYTKQKEKIETIKEYINSPEFLDWNLKFKLIDELEYRKERINKILEENKYE